MPNVFQLVEADAPRTVELFADQPDVMSKKQISALLQVDPKTIEREIQRGRLGCIRVGRCVRITKNQLIDYVKEAIDHA